MRKWWAVSVLAVSPCQQKLISDRFTPRSHSAYTTQYRDDGTVWAQTGYVGTQLTLEFLIESNGKCNEVAPGLCHDPVQQYAGKLFQ